MKCNNINVNVNGLELYVFPPFLGGEVAAEAVESNTDVNSFSGNGYGSQIKDFRFICINNNNNTVIEAEEPIPPIPPVDPCVECFIQNLNDTQLADLERALGVGIDITIGGETITIDSLLELCTELKVATPVEIMLL